MRDEIATGFNAAIAKAKGALLADGKIDLAEPRAPVSSRSSAVSSCG